MMSCRRDISGGAALGICERDIAISQLRKACKELNLATNES